MNLYLALSLGFLGSLHCIGMCGPIAFALPVVGEGAASRIAGRLIYNAGRILTYGAQGIISGLIGKGAILAGFGQTLSVISGILILLALILNLNIFSKFRLTAFANSMVSHQKSKLMKLFKKRSYLSLFSIGLLNGLLPCGLVYIALSAAISAGDIFKSGLFMMLFGLGTVPMMFAASYITNFFSMEMLRSARKAVPAIMLTLGLLLILRGMNLGIPYVSPQAHASGKAVHKCH
jgi:uncharacterized protein